MGKQAKRKKLRQENQTPLEPPPATDFVQQMQKQGYHWQNSQSAPALPDHQPRPLL